MIPTWSNGCVGKVINIAKHLDRFLMFENLWNVLGRFKPWAYSIGVSNHKALVPQLDFGNPISHYPFKFNHTWIEEQSFCDLVRKKWIVY